MNKLKLIMNLLFIIIFIGCKDNNKVEKIVIWQTESDLNARLVLDSIKEDFEKEHSIKVEIFKNSWGSQADKILMALKSKSLPDIAHVQPFMIMSLVNKDKLEPLDDVFDSLSNNGTIYNVAKEIAKHNGINYGIPYALGITSWSYNKEQCIDNFGNAKTWEKFIENAKKSRDKNPNFSILLPGASPFFMEQLYSELLANNNGRMFDNAGMPLFNSEKNQNTLKFFRDLKDFLHRDWKNQTYLDQFTMLAKENTSCVLVTYARASNTIKQLVKDTLEHNKFLLMKQACGPNRPENHSIATIDCEPWVIFKKESNNNKKRIELCKEFLIKYYDKTNYIDFVSKVPMHLTPIFSEYTKDDKYKKNIEGWEEWNKLTLDYLEENNSLSTRPILMPDTSSIGKSWGFILELQFERILFNAIIRSIDSDDEIKTIALEMQEEAITFLNLTK